MGLVDKPHTFVDETNADPTEVNENFDAIYNEFNGGIDDDNIVDYTVDADNEASGNSGPLTTLLSWLANRIRAIMGTASWYSSPPTTLEAANNHYSETTGIHGVGGSTVASQDDVDDAENSAKSYADSLASDLDDDKPDSNAGEITVSSSAPSSPSTNDVWIEV